MESREQPALVTAEAELIGLEFRLQAQNRPHAGGSLIQSAHRSNALQRPHIWCAASRHRQREVHDKVGTVPRGAEHASPCSGLVEWHLVARSIGPAVHCGLEVNDRQRRDRLTRHSQGNAAGVHVPARRLEVQSVAVAARLRGLQGRGSQRVQGRGAKRLVLLLGRPPSRFQGAPPGRPRGRACAWQ